MPNSLDVKITADVTELQSQVAVAKATVSGFNSELGKLGKTAAATGLTDSLKAQLLQTSESMLKARASLASLKSQLEDSTGSSIKFSEGLSVLERGLGALGIAASIGSVVEFGKSLFDSAEQVYHEAEVLGLTTTAYQAFAKSAQFAGVDVATVDTALRKFNVSQGEAQTGVGAAAKAFNDLGVNAKLPAEQAIPALARALLSISDQARRSRDEVAIFGRAGEEMNPALEKWALGVQALTDDLRANGHLQSEDIVKGAHEAKVAMDEAWDKVDVAWAPAVVSLTSLLADLAKGVSGVADEFKKLSEVPVVDVRTRNLADYQKSLGHGSNAEAGSLFAPSAEDIASGGVRTRNLAAYQASLANGAGAASAPQVDAPIPTARPAYYGPPPPPNNNDANDAKKAAELARKLADEQLEGAEKVALEKVTIEQQANQHLLEMGQETADAYVAQETKLENDRYAIELSYLQRKAAADAGDKVKHQKDLDDIALLEQTHQERLNQIADQGAEKRAQLDRQNVQIYIQTADSRLSAGMAELEEEYRLHQISANQKATSEKNLTNQILEQEIARLDAEMATLTKGTEAWNEAYKQREKIAESLQKDIQKIDADLNNQEQQKWNTLATGITNSFNSSLNAMLLKSKTWQQALGQVVNSVAEGFLNMGEKILENQAQQWIATQLLGQTSARASAIAQIPPAAAIAAANAFAAESAVPVVGPELAPAAASAAYAEVMSFEGLASAAGGMVLGSDQIISAHENEMVLPANLSKGIQSVVDNQGGGSGAGDGTQVAFHFAPNISAMDGANMQSWFNANARTMMNTFASQIRNSPSLRSLFD